ncbi:dTDP-4-dehydrorhamnose reductase [bacterium]|nr:dTDP-4-dehydrorhamnose reductase [bacterium]
MRILVLGHKGLLGSEIVKRYASQHELTGHDLDTLDITHSDECQRIIDRVGPELVINCAAYTDVDRAETNREQAFAVNEQGPAHLARLAHKHGFVLFHFSTDYVFNGRKVTAYVEGDCPDPLSVYGQSKRAGELRILEQTDNALIIRTSWSFGPTGKSFPKTIVQLAQNRKYLDIVADQWGCPTYTPDLAAWLEPLFNHSFRGIVHVTNSDQTTWFDFARYIFEQKGLTQVELKPVTTRDFPRPAPRPVYSVLDTSLFQQMTGLRPRSWREAVREFIRSGLL